VRGESRSVRGLPDQARDGDRGACTVAAPAPQAPGCHPSYGGACLDPGVSDYDCAGGSGNGPEYVPGPVKVVGSDDYELDADGDGVGCED
jgi:hypothetical protein